MSTFYRYLGRSGDFSFLSVCSFYFSVWKSLLRFLSSEVLCSAVFSLPLNPSKTLFISVTGNFISGLSFCSHFRSFVTLLPLPSSLACCVFDLLEPLESQSYLFCIPNLIIQHLCHIWFWCLLCLFILCFLPFNMIFNFFLIAWHDKEPAVNRPLVVWWRGTGEGKCPWSFVWAHASGLWPSRGLLSTFSLSP